MVQMLVDILEKPFLLTYFKLYFEIGKFKVFISGKKRMVNLLIDFLIIKNLFCPPAGFLNQYRKWLAYLITA